MTTENRLEFDQEDMSLLHNLNYGYIKKGERNDSMLSGLL